MKWVAFILSMFGVICMVCLLNMAMPKTIFNIGFGDFVIKSIGFISIYMKLGEIILKG